MRSLRFFLFSLILLATQSSAQNQFSIASWNWVGINSIIKNTEGKYILGGGTSFPYFTKIDSAGNVLWTKGIFLGYDIVQEMTPSNDSTFVAAINAIDSIKLMKIDFNGGVIWARAISNSPDRISISSIKQTVDNGFVFTGAISKSQPYQNIMYVGKVDSNGNLLWSKQVQIKNKSDWAYSVIELPDSTYLVSGSAEDSLALGTSACLLKISNAGSILWAKCDTFISNIFRGFEINSDSQNIFGLLNSDYSSNVLMLDSSGTTITARKLFGTDAKKIKKLKNNKLAFILPYSSYGPELCFMDSSGIVNSVYMNGTFYIDGFADYAETNSGIYLISLGMNYGIHLLDSLGNGVCTAVDSIPTTSTTVLFQSVSFTYGTTGNILTISPVLSDLSETYDSTCVLQWWGVSENSKNNSVEVYPNPSNGEFNLLSHVPGAPVDIVLTDVLGKVIYEYKNLSNERMLNLKVNTVPGLYFLKISNTENYLVKRIVIN